MIIKLEKRINKRQLRALLDRISGLGLEPHIDKGKIDTIIGIRGDTSRIEESYFMLPGVRAVKRISSTYKLVSREFHRSDTIVDVSGVKIGGGYFSVIAGPCSVESKEQLFKTAKAVKEAGALLMRGGAFKPRTSPYAFQGLEEKGLELLVKARERFHIPIVTEIMAVEHLALFEKYNIDMYQVGARNMHNYDLLEALGRINKPVLLKRGMSGYIDEWLSSAEYIVANGNPNVVLCERGIRSFEPSYRNVPDLNAIAYVKQVSHLPIIADPSHGTGVLSLIPDISLACVAVGANGLMLEVHNDRTRALSDANQQLSPEEFSMLMKQIEEMRSARNKITSLMR